QTPEALRCPPSHYGDTGERNEVGVHAAAPPLTQRTRPPHPAPAPRPRRRADTVYIRLADGQHTMPAPAIHPSRAGPAGHAPTTAAPDAVARNAAAHPSPRSG